MMLEDDDDNRDFITITKKDYYPKKSTKVSKFIPPLNYELPCNSINGPYKEHLNLVRENEKLPLEEKSEDIREYLKKIHLRYPHLQGFLPKETPDENIIEAEQKKGWKSTYRLHYSQGLDYGGDKSQVRLPDKWIIPETTQQRSFRNPKLLTTQDNLASVRNIMKRPNNLDPDLKQREILRVKTGESEYGMGIGVTGDRIFREKIVPENSKPRKVFTIEKIDCSQILENLEYPAISNVF